METNATSLCPTTRRSRFPGCAAGPFASGRVAVSAARPLGASSGGDEQPRGTARSFSRRGRAAHHGSDPGQGFVDPWRGC